jgi:hypothetical protein
MTQAEAEKEDFREKWLFYLQVVPAVCLFIDMLFNKIKFSWL